MAVRIVAVSGSTRRDSRCRILIDEAVAIAAARGADVDLIDLNEHRLPLFEEGNRALDSVPEVQHVRQSAAAADGFLLATPEYHGGISSALKNWFDFLYQEFAGKLAGILAATGGGGGDMSITATRNSVHWCHGFTLPFHATARRDDFSHGKLINDRVRDRVQRIAIDLIRYAPLLRTAFEDARKQGPGVEAGFAGMH